MRSIIYKQLKATVVSLEQDFGGIKPVSRKLEINAHGDRVWRLKISHLNENGVWIKVGRYVLGEGLTKTGEPITWPSRRTPIFYPKCGYQGCPAISEEFKRLITIALVCFGVFVLCVLYGIISWHKQKKRRALLDMGWRVLYSNLKALEDENFSTISENSSDEGDNVIKAISMGSLILPPTMRFKYEVSVIL